MILVLTDRATVLSSEYGHRNPHCFVKGLAAARRISSSRNPYSPYPSESKFIRPPLRLRTMILLSRLRSPTGVPGCLPWLCTWDDMCTWTVCGVQESAYLSVPVSVCIYVCMHACTCACMYLYILIGMYVCKYVCLTMYVCPYTCMHAWMCVCMHAWMFVCLHKRMCVVRTCLRTYACTYVHMYICMYVCMFFGWKQWMDGWMDGRMDGWTDGWMDGYVHVWMRACVYRCLDVRMPVLGFVLLVCLPAY